MLNYQRVSWVSSAIWGMISPNPIPIAASFENTIWISSWSNSKHIAPKKIMAAWVFSGVECITSSGNNMRCKLHLNAIINVDVLLFLMGYIYNYIIYIHIYLYNFIHIFKTWPVKIEGWKGAMIGKKMRLNCQTTLPVKQSDQKHVNLGPKKRK